MVSKRDFDAVKKALRFDKIPMTPPKIVVEELDEDERMKKLTKRQRQALARVQAKPKSQVSLPKMPDFMKLKKEENEMDINEKIEYVHYEFKDTADARQARRYFRGIKDVRIEFTAGKGINYLTVDAGDKDITRFHKEIVKKFKPRVLKTEGNEMDIVDTVRGIVEKKLDPVNKDALKKKFDDRKDKDIDNDGDVDSTDKYLHKRRKAVSKAIAKEELGEEMSGKDVAKRMMKIQTMKSFANKVAKMKTVTRNDLEKILPDYISGGDITKVMEAYDIGNDYAKHTLRVTPGQGEKDVDEMLGIAQKKNVGMREALAKVWGLGEGKNPFEKNEKNPLTKEEKHGKTMTGQKPTKVEVEPKMEKK